MGLAITVMKRFEINFTFERALSLVFLKKEKKTNIGRKNAQSKPYYILTIFEWGY